jgi:dephospho-CoA kinase
MAGVWGRAPGSPTPGNTEHVLKVGLTGGIGAGKSEAAHRLARNGAIVIDADKLAREVVEPNSGGLAEIVQLFGPDVLTADGTLNRPALGAKVFQDGEARRRLERIIHPRVRARTAEITHAAPPDAIVVNDVPLLIETGLAASYHLVLVVDADQDRRIRRLTETRGMTKDQAAARIAAQADDHQRRAAADVLIDNNGDIATLHQQIDLLVRDRLRPFEQHQRLRTIPPLPTAMPLTDPDPEWPTAANRLIARIHHHAPDHTEITHIGSTAVPGLPAQDVIDLMLAVRTLDEADDLAPRLADAGFPRREGEWADNARGLPGQTWPKRLHGSADPGRPANLHIRVAGSPGWRFALVMRDHLRADPAARDDYAAAKACWAVQHQDLFAYGEAKEPWFDIEARAADDWAESTGWQPS